MSYLKPHRWAAFCGLLCAVWLSLPSWLMRAERSFYERRFPAYFLSWPNNGRYSPIDTFSMAEDNDYYAARIRHAATHAWPGDPYVRGSRSARLALTDFITFEAYAALWRAIGEPRAAWEWAQFLFALLWVPCLYALLLELGAERDQAICVAVALTLFADLARALFFNLEHPLGTLKQAVQYSFWFLGPYQYFFGPTRLTGPLFTYPCLFLASLAFVRGDASKRWPAAAASGLAGGLLAYVHADVFLTFLGGAASYALWSLWRRPAPDRFRPLVSVAAAGLASLPWLLYCRPRPIDRILLGLAPGRAFSVPSLPLLAGALLALTRLRDRRMGLWCGCCLLALFVACNAQLAIGWTLAQGHWHYLGNVLLAVVVGAWLARLSKAPAGLWPALCVMTYLLALPRTISYAAAHYQLSALPALEEEAYAWLDRNTPKDAVVAALSPDTNLRLPVHTHAKTVPAFLFPVMSDITPLENAKRIVYALSLYGARLDDFLRQATDEPGRWVDELWQGRVDPRARERSGIVWLHYCSMTPEQALPYLRQAQSLAVEDFGADYLWAGAFEKGLVDRGRRRLGRAKLFDNGAVEIWRLR